jgi:hypothetical protein
MTMKTTKTIVLAAVAALSIGVGTAMAQSEVPSGSETAYLFGQRQAALKIIKHGSDQSQNPYDVTTHPQLDRSIGDSGG